MKTEVFFKPGVQKHLLERLLRKLKTQREIARVLDTYPNAIPYCINEDRSLLINQVKNVCNILNIPFSDLKKNVIASISREEWKYLLRELILYYTPHEINKALSVKESNRASLYKWLRGDSCPGYVKQRRKLLNMAEKIDRPIKLVSENKRKDNLLISYNKQIIQKDYIDSLALIRTEIMRRRKTSSNMWYISEINQRLINIRYTTSTGSGKNVILPRMIRLDSTLFRLLGFWLGDGVTEISGTSVSAYKSHISFSSGEADVIEETINLFKEFFIQEDSIFDIEVIYGKAVNPKRKRTFIKYLKTLNTRRVMEREHMRWNSLGASVNIRNSALAYLFRFLYENITLVNSKKRAMPFLGGYFTAEGSTSKTNKFFLFHETKEDRRELIKNLLMKLGFCKPFEPRLWRDRIVVAHNERIRDKDIKLFGELISPYVFSKRKLKEANDLISGNYLRDIDLVYLYYLRLHKNLTSNELCKAFDKSRDHIVKVYKRLEETKDPLVKRKRKDDAVTCFYKTQLTARGNKTVTYNVNKIKEILKEAIRVHQFGKSFRGTFRLYDNKGKPVQAINEMIQDLSLYPKAA